MVNSSVLWIRKMGLDITKTVWGECGEITGIRNVLCEGVDVWGISNLLKCKDLNIY